MKSSFLIWLSILMVTVNAFAQEGWIEKDASIGLTNTLNDVILIDSDNGFAVGEEGTIIKTTDGGLNWSALTSGTSEKLNAVCFVDLLTGWAVGNDRTVLKTTDGGVNWDSQLSYMSYRHCYDVFFIDADTGWTVCRDNFTGYIALVYKTTDGGDNWQSVQTGYSANLHSLFFINSSVGWTAGGYGIISKSTDGGETWTGQRTPTTEALYSLYFIDSNNGWAAGAHGVVLKTTDGGANWTVCQTGTTDNLKSITFQSTLLGWTTGANGTILKTDDGGVTWAMQNSGTSNELNSVCFINNSTGMTAGQNALILSTTDGGGQVFLPPTLVSPSNASNMNLVDLTLNWNSEAGASSYRLQISTSTIFSATVVDQSDITESSYSVSVLSENTTYYWRVNVTYPGGTGNWSPVWSFATSGLSWHAQVSNTTNDINSVFFINPNTAWAVGGNATILKTSDGGVHWIPQRSPQSWGMYYSVFFINSSVGWILGQQGSIYKTTDGGLNWTDQSWDFNGSLFSGQFTDALTGWLATDLGIFHSTDGGTIWNEVSLDTEYGFWYSVYFVDKLNGWIGNSQGEICRTTDGGENWVKQYMSGYALKSLFFIDNQTGWAAGEDGFIMKTADGGESWISICSGSDQTLNSVKFINDQIGWITGENGLILKSVDGGDSWAAQVSKTDKNLKSIHFNDAQTGWITGSDGMILKTTDGGGVLLTPPAPVSPNDRSTGLETNPELSWNPVADAISYHVQVCQYPIFHTSVTDLSPLTGTSTNLAGLSDNSVYYWRVQATYPEGVSNWSEIQGFATAGAGWEAQVSGVFERLESVCFVDENIGWTVGHDGPLLKTDDGGINWNEQFSPDSYLEEIYFLNETTGWVCNSSNIYSTTDGGENWVKSVFGVGYTILDFHFVDNLNGWAVGYGDILRTTDGGLNWTVQESGLTDYLQSVYFIDSQTGWAVGNNGSILKTLNGGIEWIPQSSNTTESLSYVQFVDNLTGWACNNYSVFRTIDGGTTWEYYDNGADYWLAAYYFINDSTGWGTGYGCIQKTTDGGITWSQQPIMNDYSYYSIFFVNDTTGYAVGDDGIILKTTSGGFLSDVTVQAPVLLFPSNYNVDEPTTSIFMWDPGMNAKSYVLVIDDDIDFGSPVYNTGGISETSQLVAGLYAYSSYYWKVGSTGKDGSVVWSDVWTFMTKMEIPQIRLITPSENQILSENSVYFSWETKNLQYDWINNYHFELATDSLMNNLVVVDSLLFSWEAYKTVDSLVDQQTYWWRVRGDCYLGWGPFSLQGKFRIEMPTGISIRPELQRKFFLGRNYPDPFDASTTIEYVLPVSAEVELKVLDFLGREVQILVKEVQSAGNYSVHFDRQNLSPGIYFYQLRAGKGVKKEKMIIF